MKKWICMLLALLCLAPGALAAAPSVVDLADLFTPAEEADLAGAITDFQQMTGMDFAVITTYEAHEESLAAWADAFYDEGGYGLDDENSGVLYLIDMYERTPYICTTGAMIDYLTDERIEKTHDKSYDALVNGNYYEAAEKVILETYLNYQRGIPEGQYQYDAITGQRLTARHKALTPGEIGVSAIAALVIGWIFMRSVQSGYSLKGSTYSYDYRANSEVDVTASQDDFLRTTTVRTRKADPPSGGGGGNHSGGSSVHRSSGGVSHGGGAGRKF